MFPKNSATWCVRIGQAELVNLREKGEPLESLLEAAAATASCGGHQARHLLGHKAQFPAHLASSRLQRKLQEQGIIKR